MMFEGATFTTPGYPAITQITFLTCCAQYPGGSNRCTYRLLPCPCCLPRLTGGSASTTSLLRNRGVSGFVFSAEFLAVLGCFSRRRLSRPAQASLALRPTRSQPAPRRTFVPRLRLDQLPHQVAR